jgi:Secretion system C-terminal sorting domain
MYKYFFSLFFVLFIISFRSSLCQPNYTVQVTNGKLINNKIYQFDVILNSRSNFEITSYQCVFTLYCNSLVNDSLAFEMVGGSSQLENKATLGFSAKIINGKAELTFASRAGSEIIGKGTYKVGTFRVIRKKDFDFNSVFVNWNFKGSNITIVTGRQFSDITNSSSFLSDMHLVEITDVRKSQIPNDYKLEQNYPNPFNPSTKISFSLKERGKVNLNIFNILGQKIAELLNEDLPAGHHEVEFNAKNLASGIYIYQLKVGNKFTATKKMILQK